MPRKPETTPLPSGPKPDAPSSIAERVIEWQAHHGRHGLPWQGSRDPYRVWLSEVMLQQTQVGTVLTYYERFLARFPDVSALARASLDDVLSQWSGLGYYSRARNLWRCAQAVVEQHDGRFPSTAAELETLPGIGRSTAAAIAAFCFGEQVAILDGNVKRVLTRALGFGDDLASAPAQQRLWTLAEGLLPQRGIESYTQGLMDLGASVCSVREPQCLLCPLEAVCEGRRLGDPTRFPVKSRRLKRGERFSVWLWLEHRKRWWLVRRPATGVWGGLWSLPEFADLASALDHLGGHQEHVQTLPVVQHALTHFDWTLQPLRCVLPDRLGDRSVAGLTDLLGEGNWIAAAEARQLGLPAPLRKLFDGG